MKGEETQKVDSTLIDKGGHGCVFTPPIPCKKSKVAKAIKATKATKATKARIVGKVIKKDNAEVELKAASIVKGIPGWQRFFILQEQDSCNSSNFHTLKKTYSKECAMMQKAADKNLTQLISPYGGKTLLSIDSTFDFIGNLRHVLEGCALLQEAGLCHYDIKELNILVSDSGTLRLIDFGSAFIGDAVTEDNLWRNQYPFIPEYGPQPPEFSVQCGLHAGLGYAHSIRETVAKKFAFKLIENILGITTEKNAADMKKFWEEQGEWKGDSWVPFFHTYWRKWDSWGVGVIFIRILQMCLFKHKFVEEVWKKDRDVIKNVLKGLLAVDPRERLTCVAALLLLPH